MNFNIKTVLGASYGDEGKGKVISMLTQKIIEKNEKFYSKIAKQEILGYSIRSNGGPNGGHALVAQDGTKITGHVLPSTITKEGFVNIIGAGCALNLEGLQKEINDFKQANLFKGVLAIDPRASIILNAYKILDGFKGMYSTGSGIANTYSFAAKRDGLRMADLAEPEERNIDKKIKKLSQSLQSEYLGIAKERNTSQEDINKFLNITTEEAIKEELIQYETSLGSLVSFDIEDELPKAAIEGRDILNETSQSYFLSLAQNDQTGTSSIIDPNWLFVSQGIPTMPQEVHLITKLFASRVGYGAFPGEIGDRDAALRRQECLEKHNINPEDKEEFLNKIKELSSSENAQDQGDALRLLYNEYGETTQRPRGKAPLDLTYLRTLYRNIGASKINKTYLWINQVDGANDLYEEIPFIDAHINEQGEEIDHFSPLMVDVSVKELGISTFTMTAWKGELSTKNPLPNEVITILEEIKQRTNLPIGGIGIGRKDSDVILYDYKN